ncbi:hypothetical protein EC991_000182 [Linnemannia zychae]|nr:hypothetical protein EC991_000182 [Linnemannia zychae]
MSTNIKKRNYRKKREDSPEDSPATTSSETGGVEDSAAQENEPEGLSLDELIELRKYRQRPSGIAAVDLLVGDTTGKKKKKDKIVAVDPWKLSSGGGLVDMDEVRRTEESESTTKSGMTNTFMKQTNKLDVDKHMMKYIEDEMKRRRGEAGDAEDTTDQAGNYNGDTDILDELGIRKTAPRPEQEGNVQLSTTMLTAIPEVDLGMEAKLKNIEETERAKRKLYEERTTTSITANERFSQPAYIPSDSERISHHRQNGRNNNSNNNNSNNNRNNYNNNNNQPGVPNHRFQNYGNNNHHGKGGAGRGMATDDLVMERFKKRTMCTWIPLFSGHLHRQCSRRRDDLEQDLEQGLGWNGEQADAKREELKIMHVLEFLCDEILAIQKIEISSEHEDVFIWRGIARILHSHEVVIRVGELGSSSTREDRRDIEEQFGGTESGVRSRKIDIMHQLYPRGAKCPIEIVAWEAKPDGAFAETLQVQLRKNIRTNASMMNKLAPYLDSGFPRQAPIVVDIIGSRALAYIVHKIEPGVFGAGAISEDLIELPRAADEIKGLLFNGSMWALLRVEASEYDYRQP